MKKTFRKTFQEQCLLVLPLHFMKRHALGSHTSLPLWVRLIADLCQSRCSMSALWAAQSVVLPGTRVTAPKAGIGHMTSAGGCGLMLNRAKSFWFRCIIPFVLLKVSTGNGYAFSNKKVEFGTYLFVPIWKRNSGENIFRRNSRWVQAQPPPWCRRIASTDLSGSSLELAVDSEQKTCSSPSLRRNTSHFQGSEERGEFMHKF